MMKPVPCDRGGDSKPDFLRRASSIGSERKKGFKYQTPLSVKRADRSSPSVASLLLHFISREEEKKPSNGKHTTVTIAPKLHPSITLPFLFARRPPLLASRLRKSSNASLKYHHHHHHHHHHLIIIIIAVVVAPAAAAAAIPNPPKPRPVQKEISQTPPPAQRAR